jgi:glycerol-3-phosphate O-acyltransferase
MTSLPNTKEFADIANRIIWFEPAETAMRDSTRFMAYAFRYASHDDMQVLRTKLTDDDLRAALANAPPGIIDPRSWSYWHAILGAFPPPPMPQRRLE